MLSSKVSSITQCRRVAPFSAVRVRVAPVNASRKASNVENSSSSIISPTIMSALTMYLASAAPAMADETVTSSNSLYLTGALFLMCVPGIWSQVKRAPKAAKKRITFEVPGPGVEGAIPISERAKQIFRYFKTYNYDVKETGEVIVFAGIYKPESGQAWALALYTFFGLASIALVGSTVTGQENGNWWYGITALTPLAPWYYWKNGTREEEARIKMVTADDDKTTDIIIEADKEEIDRFRKELNLMEKGKVYVKGILEK